MSNAWYPTKIMVGPEGTPQTYRFMETQYNREQFFSYAEFGFYKADTARNICQRFPNCHLHLFDFYENIDFAKEKLKDFPNLVSYYGNTQKFNDSYNWNLIKLIINNRYQPIFDYCFLDGAHTFAIDALNFFLCDRLTRVGGFIDFDDYDWTLRDSSLDPIKVPIIAEQYTDEQIDTRQVAVIIDHLVRPDKRYREVVERKVFQKIAP